MPEKKQSFDELWAPHESHLFRVASQYLPGEEASQEDAVAGAREKGLTAFKSLRQEDLFLPWMKKILERVCLNILKKRKKDPLFLTTPPSLSTGDDEEENDAQGDIESLPDPKQDIDPEGVNGYHIDLTDDGLIAVTYVIEPNAEIDEGKVVSRQRLALKGEFPEFYLGYWDIKWKGGREQAAAVLREDLNGTPQKEIAEKLGISHGNVRQIVSRLRKRRKEAEKENEERKKKRTEKSVAT